MLGSDSEEATKKVLPVLNTFAQKAMLLRKRFFPILDPCDNRVFTIAFQFMRGHLIGLRVEGFASVNLM